MENQKIINLLDNTPNQPSKFKIKNWVKIYNDTQEIYNTNSQIKFITSMLKSGLYGYSGAHILLSGTITVPNTGTETSPNNRKNILTKNCAPFTDCIRELNNTQINSSKDIDKVMQMYNLIEYSRNYSKRSESL